MKALRNILLTGLFMMALTLIGAAGQTAGVLPGGPGADEAYADTEYTVFIYSGKEGYFGDEDTTVQKITGLKYGEEVTVSLEDLDLKVKNPDQYYVRGLKIAGHDNDELSSMRFQSYSFEVKEDTAFSVSYGMAGGMVKYTVRYVDKSGKSLLDPEEFYGMAGDKPVVAYRLIEGYLPEDENQAKTLSSNEADNVFTFTYHKAEGVPGGEGEEGDEDEGEGDNDGGNNGGGNAGGNAGGNGAANGPGNGPATADIGDGDTPLAGITDLDDGETPMAPGNDEEKSGLLSGINGLMAGIVGAGVLIALLLLYLVLRKGRKEEQ